MKTSRMIFFVVVFSNVFFGFAQKVLEFDNLYNIEFIVYDDSNGKYPKLIKESDFSLESPEKVAQAYFFAFDNSWLAKLYLDKEDALKRDESHYNNVSKTKSEDIHMQLLHKMVYKYQGKKMCYIMFIVKIKDVPFYFPTLVPLVEVGNKWMIDLRANQDKLTQCLSMFKPCVLSNLIEGKSSNLAVDELISKTKTKNGNLDFIKLYDEFIKISKDEKKSAELTMAENMVCDMDYKKQVAGKVNFTGVFEKIDVKKYDKDEQKDYKNLISLVKKNNDSIFLNEKMDITYNNKIFSVLKYDTFKGGIKKSVSSRIDGNAENYKPVQNLIILYQNLDTKIFNDLTPSIDKEKNKRQESEVLYQKTRGVYNVLNITKLYNLFTENKPLFTNYIYKKIRG